MTAPRSLLVAVAATSSGSAIDLRASRSMQTATIVASIASVPSASTIIRWPKVSDLVPTFCILVSILIASPSVSSRLKSISQRSIDSAFRPCAEFSPRPTFSMTANPAWLMRPM